MEYNHSVGCHLSIRKCQQFLSYEEEPEISLKDLETFPPPTPHPLRGCPHLTKMPQAT